VPDIHINTLCKAFRPGFNVLHALNLSIPTGEFLSVVGPSGSGKTTLLRLLAGLETPTSGSIHFGSRRVDALSPSERAVAVVFQNPAPYPHLRVRANIAFSVKAHESNRAEIRRRVDSAAEFLGISGLMARRPDELSGGERQRVVLARAIARRPELLLLDEPLTGLDAPLREDVRRTLSSIHREHAMTILMVTHDQADALALGERVAVLDRGILQQCDAPETLYRQPATEFVARFIGDPPMTILDAMTTDGTLTLTSTDPPTRLPLPSEIARRFRDGPIRVGFRPEVLRVDPPGDLTAAVERIEHAGRDQVVWLRSGTQRLALRLDADRKINVGERLPIRFDLAAIHGFDTKGNHINGALH
jgi:ABC-type sugar transport system ATPase subunit